MTVNAFLLEPIIKLSKFYEIYILLNLDSKESLPSLDGVAKVLPVNIQRKIRLKSDLAALWQLFKLFRYHNFQVVHSVTPKAGLLAMLAAYAARVPLRIHTFTGQVWVTKFGLKRFLLKRFDCFIAFLTTHNIVDSPSQHQFLVDEKVMTSAKSVVYAKGSISGVDVVRFKPNVLARENIRQQLNIPDDAIVFIFLGRLTRDKGVLNLALAFSYLQNGGAHLLFVGPDEQSMQTEIMQITRLYGDSVHFVEHTNVQNHHKA